MMKELRVHSERHLFCFCLAPWSEQLAPMVDVGLDGNEVRDEIKPISFLELLHPCSTLDAAKRNILIRHDFD
jgi:hypothetical protein